MIKKYPLLLFCLLLGIGIQVQAQGLSFLQTNGKAIVNASGDSVILKGMGLGGWMLQEGYMMQTAGFANAQYELRAKIEEVIGAAATDSFYNAWLANHVTQTDIDSLASWGFNSVRLPMHYNLYTLPVELEPVNGMNTWLTKGFILTDSLISWCKQNEMYVILDLHAAPGGQGQDAGISDYDPTKFSLWESPANQAKTAALWKKLAERYVNEPYVAGYDLINEPNWPLPNGTLLRSVYEQITDSIRSVDTNHIVFIEGNWFANDFTGLTPAWDSNMVYSPHKYWSFNDQASIQWVLDLREAENVPLFFGETGENSNTWFTEAIELFDQHKIGWAWWNMKKIEDIKGPLQIIKNPAYQDLLDYWSGNGPQPGVAAATAAMMQLAENIKIQNCFYQKDVPDAMFEQINSNATRAFQQHNLPGKVYAANFDLGRVGAAYEDTDVATYHLSTGTFTAWNKGWSYRNDGVDIEPTQDSANTLGYNVGWLDPGEWMQYEVEVDSAGLFDVSLRVAAGNGNGKFHFGVDGADLSETMSVGSTGGWQNWQDFTVNDLVLEAGNQKLRFYMEQGGFNLSSFEFSFTGPSTSLATEFLSAFTVDDHTVELNLNKALAGPLPGSPADFEILVGGTPVTILQSNLGVASTRAIRFTVDHTFLFSDLIQISYTGNQILATDGTALNPFTLEDVQNNEPVVHAVPGKVEAEAFFFQEGVQLENTSDAGGGQNVGFLDPGDYMDYYISVDQAGSYEVAYRTASLNGNGALELQLIDSSGTATVLHDVSFQSTGGWQDWTTTSKSVQLPAGRQHMRVVITAAPFNLNWYDFTASTAIENITPINGLNLFPNPGTGRFTLEGNLAFPQKVDVLIFNALGQLLQSNSLNGVYDLRMNLDLSSYPNGGYLVAIRLEDGSLHTRRLIKASN